jgi:hypothetical protein
MDLKKELGGVADAVIKIMMDEKALHPNQQKLDVHEPEKDELTADDFKKLRAGKKAPEVKKEEVEEIDELDKSTLGSYIKKASKDIAKHTIATRDYGDKAGKSKKHSDFVDNAMASVKSTQKADKRQDNIAKAVNRLTKEEVEEIDEAPSKESMEKAASDKKIKHEIAADRIEQKQKNMMKKAASDKKMKEEVEQIDEYKSTGGVYKHKGTYGTEKSLEAGYTDFDKENELAKKNLKTKKPKKYGARQNFVRSTRVNESFTSILASYKENGLKGISEMFATEQASQEEYDKEIEKAKAKSQGKDKAEVAKASVQAVKSEQTHTKIEVIDMTDPYNIQKREIDLEERQMTEPEMKKKEEIVKSMKKGMKGFKERYGERAKEVMYATATKQAMKD